MKFKDYSQAPKSESGGTTFLKIGDGESVNVVLRGEVYEFYTKWVDQKSQITSAEDPEGRLRFRVNAVVHEDGAFKCKILEFGKPLYYQFNEINDEYPLETIKLKITRKGQKLETTYMVLPLLGEKDKLTPKLLGEIEALPLNMLEHRPQVVHDDEVNKFGF